MNPQQQRFVSEYIIDFNATQAAIRAGYSKTSAYAIGSALLKKHEVQDAIVEALEDFAESAIVLKKRIVKKLTKITFDGVEETKYQLKAMELLSKHIGVGVTEIQNYQESNRDKKILTFSEFCTNAGYPAPYPKQIEMKEFGIDGDSPRLLLGARGYGKTDYVTIMGVAHAIYLNPLEESTLIVTKSQERNAAILAEIANACSMAGMQFELNNSNTLRVKGFLGKDHTCSALTINSTGFRGRHPNRVIMDDPVTPDDTSEATRLKVKKVYDEIYKLNKNILIIGQPVHKFDLYETLRPQLVKMEVPYGSIPELDVDLEAQRLAGVDEASIQASYFLKIISEGTVAFDNIRYIDNYPTGMNSVAFIDPSFTGGDYTAITILCGLMQGVAVYGKVWKKAWNHCLEDMVPLLKKYNVRKLAFETNSLGTQPLDVLREAFGQEIGVIGRVSNTNKHSRIMTAGAYAHMIHLTKESDPTYVKHVVEYEYKAKFDDAPDSLASCLEWVGLIRGKQ